MRKIALFAAFLIFFAVTSTAYAHPPSDIKITFDPMTNILTAVIAHNTSNPSNHYIKKVDIGLNGKEIIEHTISRQDNNAEQTVSYRIPDNYFPWLAYISGKITDLAARQVIHIGIFQVFKHAQLFDF